MKAKVTTGTILTLCWAMNPDKSFHCTEAPKHRGDHCHKSTQTTWPRRRGEDR